MASPQKGEVPDVREALLESSLPVVFEAYDQGLQEGLKIPVVFLLDCEDNLGGQIARAWRGDEAVENAIALEQLQAEDREATTVLAAAFAFATCQQEVPSFFPYLADTFAHPPAAADLLAVVVADGGAATFTVPLAVRPE